MLTTDHCQQPLPLCCDPGSRRTGLLGGLSVGDINVLSKGYSEVPEQLLSPQRSRGPSAAPSPAPEGIAADLNPNAATQPLPVAAGQAEGRQPSRSTKYLLHLFRRVLLRPLQIHPRRGVWNSFRPI